MPISRHEEEEFQRTGTPAASGGYRNNVVHTNSSEEYYLAGLAKKGAAQKCLNCLSNNGGFCIKYGKWANVVNANCGNSSSTRKKKKKTRPTQEMVKITSCSRKTSELTSLLTNTDNNYYVAIIIKKGEACYQSNAVMRYGNYVKTLQFSTKTANYGEAVTKSILNFISHITKNNCHVSIFVNNTERQMPACGSSLREINENAIAYNRYYAIEVIDSRFSYVLEDACKILLTDTKYKHL